MSDKPEDSSIALIVTFLAIGLLIGGAIGFVSGLGSAKNHALAVRAAQPSAQMCFSYGELAQAVRPGPHPESDQLIADLQRICGADK